MSRVVTDVANDDLERVTSALQADFDCTCKTRQVDGRWTVTGYNLNLDANEPFRAFVVAAAERIGIDPASVAALIDIEAAKTVSGQWDPHSRNPQSTACGLTQFVRATWLEMAARPATFLNAMVTTHNAAGDEEAVLNLRFDAQCSIMTAADYGAFNLGRLINAQLVAPDASDDDKARFMYLAHHDGLRGAERWLRGEIGEDEAREKLINAAGAAQAAQAKIGHSTWAEAYLTWIFSKVTPDRFRE